MFMDMVPVVIRTFGFAGQQMGLPAAQRIVESLFVCPGHLHSINAMAWPHQTMAARSKSASTTNACNVKAKAPGSVPSSCKTDPGVG